MQAHFNYCARLYFSSEHFTFSMRARTLIFVLSLALGRGIASAKAPPHDINDPQTPAKELFGRAKDPAPMAADPVGFYSRGCLAGSEALLPNGPHWQAMRPSRNRVWGHPNLIRFLERFSASAAKASGWPGILIGDMAQPRGGPMLTGHASHQIGLDADIWLKPMPAQTLSRAEREAVSSNLVVRKDRLDIEPTAWTPAHLAVIRTAAQDDAVQRIFVNPAIKRAICRSAKGEPWLRKVRPEYGHDYHFHVRLFCPAGQSLCTEQDPTPEGDGCDASLEWWFTAEALHPVRKPPSPPLTLDQLPAECRRVLSAK